MPRLFITHAAEDDPLAERLCARLEALGVPCWVDSGPLRAADRSRQVRAAFDEAGAQLVLLTPDALRSERVAREVAWGLERADVDPSFRLLPLLSGVEREQLHAPVAKLREHIVAELGSGWRFGPAVEQILHALGRIPPPPLLPTVARPPGVHELVLWFDAPALEEVAEDTPERPIRRTRLCADLRLLVQRPDAGGEQEVTRLGPVNRFEAPIGPIEGDDLCWYLEDYWRWPAEVFRERARRIERRFPAWGRALLDAVLGVSGEARAVFQEWLEASRRDHRLLTVRVTLPAVHAGVEESPEADLARTAQRGAAALLGLPWELLRTGRYYLVERATPVSVRRQPVVEHDGAPRAEETIAVAPPLRVLVVVARPEKAGLIDPRLARAVVDAVAPLGAAVELEFLRPPTLSRLAAELTAAWQAGRPYHVLHFDGHGVYDPLEGLGALCFEHDDPAKRAEGAVDRVTARRLEEVLGEVRLPLVFLEACQSARADDKDDPTAAVATALLAAGAGSVLAMSHSVLVETARRFTREFYGALAHGERIGAAVTRARADLLGDRNRGRGGGDQPLVLDDWFVPVLLQRGDDPALLVGGEAALADRTARDERAFRLHSLPKAPEHDFVGRAREHLAVERALEDHRVAVVHGIGGQGKTALAREAATWLHDTGRFPGGVAWVSVEDVPEPDRFLDRIGRAVVPGFTLDGAAGRLGMAPLEGESHAATDRRAALAIVHDHARHHATLLVVDNLETILPPPEGAPDDERATHRPDVLQAALDLAATLADEGESRALVTTRALPADERFREGRTTRVVPLGPLPEPDAVALVGHLCRLRRVQVGGDGAAERALVRAVACHARSLVLLPGLLEGRSLQGVTDDLRALMERLEAEFGDDRERSLYASLQLSLDRLPARFRETVRWLGLFRVGVFDQTMGVVLELDEAEREALVRALENAALVTREGSWLRFHPALPHFLARELERAVPEPEREARWERAVAAYEALVGFLYRLQFRERPEVASGLAVRELPNLLRALAHRAAAAGGDPAQAERGVDVATSLEGLLEETGERRARAHVAKLRERMAESLEASETLTHARYLALGAAVDRLLEQRALPEALAAARALVAQFEQTSTDGAAPYPEAAYDCAGAHFRLGRALIAAGRPDAALPSIDLAQAAFEAIAKGSPAAARMASVCLAEGAGCLASTGQLDAAADRYEENVRRAGAIADERQGAVGLGNLASVRLGQGRLQEALAGLQEARETFERLGEPRSVAGIWQQIGIVFQKAGRHTDAQEAYQNALRLRREQGDPRAAGTLGQLGVCATAAGRLEEAVLWGRAAVEAFREIGDDANESLARSNLANPLRQLGRLHEALAEAKQAARLKEALGVASEPWKTWNILCELHEARGEDAAAAAAREKAVAWYRRYRDQGGHPQSPGAGYAAATERALASGQAEQATAELTSLLEQPDAPDWLRRFAPALLAVLRGDPAAARAALATLDYDDAAELELLLERLEAPPPAPPEEDA